MRMGLLIAALALGSAASALAVSYVFESPTDDRWHYPFNFMPGSRPFAPCFSSVGNLTWTGFNDRDGVFIIAWDTTDQISPGLPPHVYDICHIRVTLRHVANADWAVDLSTDEFHTFDFNNDGFINRDGVPRGRPGDTDGESDDLDPGRPLELFGAAFGPYFTLQTWDEYSYYVGATCDLSGPCDHAPRDPFPFVYQQETFNLLHVEDSVKGSWNGHLPQPVYQFTPTTWAIGVPVGYRPGQQPVPFDVVFDIDLSLSDGAVAGYFRQQLSAGRVVVIITSLKETEMGAGGNPTFYTKEGAAADPAGRAPALTLVLADGADGDMNADGRIDRLDWRLLIDCLGGPGSIQPRAVPLTGDICVCVLDFDEDRDVDLRDVAEWMTRFGETP